MRTAKSIIPFILIIAILSSGLPIFSPNDVNKDDKITLEDLIISVRDFSNTADRPASFTSNMKRVLSTLNVVVGLKTEIKTANDVQSMSSVSSLNLTYLTPTKPILNQSDNHWKIIEKPFFYKSFVSSPDTPPPKAL